MQTAHSKRWPKAWTLTHATAGYLGQSDGGRWYSFDFFSIHFSDAFPQKGASAPCAFIVSGYSKAGGRSSGAFQVYGSGRFWGQKF